MTPTWISFVEIFSVPTKSPIADIRDEWIEEVCAEASMMNRMSSLHVDAKVNEKCVCVCLMKKLIEYTSSCVVTEEQNIRDNIVENKISPEHTSGYPDKMDPNPHMRSVFPATCLYRVSHA